MSELKPPIFVVGAPRSGTTLLATFLASHSHIFCGPETHFFPYLEANFSNLSSLLNGRNWSTRATQFMTELTVNDNRIIDLFEMTSQQIEHHLFNRKPSIQALLESLTMEKMMATQKGRWAEKTPNHILHLRSIRALYPKAAIIRIIRDPRDAAASMAAKLPWASQVPLENAYLINDWYQKSQDFFRRDSLTFSLRYEDLVMQPEEKLKQLCDFIGEPFERAMLNRQDAAEQTAPDQEPWKKQVSQPLDASRCYAWKRRDRTAEVDAIGTVCQTLIEKFDFERSQDSLTPIAAQNVSYRFARSRSSMISNLLNQGKVLIPENALAKQSYSTLVYCDIPIYGNNHGKSLRKFADFLKGIWEQRSRGMTITFSDFCQHPSTEKNSLGKLAAQILKMVGSKTRWPI